MTEKKKRPIGWKTVLTGVGIILLSVLLILFAVFFPRFRQTAKMKQTLKRFVGEPYTYVLVNDPLAPTGDLLGNLGREVRLSDEEVASLRGELAAILEGGLHYEGTEQTFGGSFDLQILLRAKAGDFVQFFMTREHLIFVQGTAVSYFTPKNDGESVAALYDKLQVLLTAESF